MTEDWQPLSKAAKEIGTSPTKLSKLVADGKIDKKKDPFDERKTLVDMDQVKSLFNVGEEKEDNHSKG